MGKLKATSFEFYPSETWDYTKQSHTREQILDTLTNSEVAVVLKVYYELGRWDVKLQQKFFLWVFFLTCLSKDALAPVVEQVFVSCPSFLALFVCTCSDMTHSPPRPSYKREI